MPQERVQLCGRDGSSLATVVIGGLITSTALTLFVLPAICHLVMRKLRHSPEKLE